MPKIQKGQAAVINQEEFRRMIKILSVMKNSKRNLLLMLFSYGTGMRAIEISALKINDILDERGNIMEEVTLRTTKGNKPRPIYLNNTRLKEAIMDYIEERKSSQNKFIFNYSQPLFVSKLGLGFSAKGMQKLFQYLYRKCGMKGASSHSGRRTFLTRLSEAGVDIKTMQKLAGHSSPTMTLQYIEANPMRMKKVVSKVLY